MLLTLEPMVHLPFDLSIDFESRLAAEKVTKQDKGLLGQEVGVVSGDGSDGSLSTSAEQSPPSVSHHLCHTKLMWYCGVSCAIL